MKIFNYKFFLSIVTQQRTREIFLFNFTFIYKLFFPVNYRNCFWWCDFALIIDRLSCVNRAPKNYLFILRITILLIFIVCIHMSMFSSLTQEINVTYFYPDKIEIIHIIIIYSIMIFVSSEKKYKNYRRKLFSSQN